MTQQAKASGVGQKLPDKEALQSALDDFDKLVGEMRSTIGLIERVKRQADKSAQKDGFLGPNMKLYAQITSLLTNLSKLVASSKKSQKVIMSNLQSMGRPS